MNGKLDRTALTERAFAHDRRASTPGRTSSAHERPVPAGDGALAALAKVFGEALSGVDADADTDFFVAGGDSIIAITVVNRARALGLPITPRDVFLLRTPRALAAHVRTHAPPVTAPVRHEDGPLTPTPIILRQRELGGSLARFAQARTLVAPEGIRFEDVERAANAVVAAHPMLRLRLRTEHGVWTLRTDPPHPITVTRPEAVTDPAALADELAGRLDPEAGEVVAFAWLVESRTLVIVVHHLAVDAVSWLILLDDLATALRGTPLTPSGHLVRRVRRRPGHGSHPGPGGRHPRPLDHRTPGAPAAIRGDR